MALRVIMLGAAAVVSGGMAIREKLSSAPVPSLRRPGERFQTFKLTVRILAANISGLEAPGMMSFERPYLTASIGGSSKETEFADYDADTPQEGVPKHVEMWPWRFSDSLTYRCRIEDVLGQGVKFELHLRKDIVLGFATMQMRPVQAAEGLADLKGNVLPACIPRLGGPEASAANDFGTRAFKSPVVFVEMAHVKGGPLGESVQLGEAVAHLALVFSFDKDPAEISLAAGLKPPTIAGAVKKKAAATKAKVKDSVKNSACSVKDSVKTSAKAVMSPLNPLKAGASKVAAAPQALSASAAKAVTTPLKTAQSAVVRAAADSLARTKTPKKPQAVTNEPGNAPPAQPPVEGESLMAKVLALGLRIRLPKACEQELARRDQITNEAALRCQGRTLAITNKPASPEKPPVVKKDDAALRRQQDAKACDQELELATLASTSAPSSAPPSAPLSAHTSFHSIFEANAALELEPYEDCVKSNNCNNEDPSDPTTFSKKKKKRNLLDKAKDEIVSVVQGWLDEPMATTEMCSDLFLPKMPKTYVDEEAAKRRAELRAWIISSGDNQEALPDPEIDPDGWVSTKGPHGQHYWHHLSMGPAPWQATEDDAVSFHEAAMASPMTTQRSVSRCPSRSLSFMGPDESMQGWLCHTGTSGRTFWHHEDLGPAPWTLPEWSEADHIE